MSKKSIVIITPHKTLYFPSITEASKATGISKQRILRALESEDGEIPRIKNPHLYVDEAIEPKREE